MARLSKLRREFVDPSDLVVRGGEPDAPLQFRIENADGVMEDFDKQYVALSGFVGIHNPHTFAMAPKLLAELEFAVKLMRALPALSGSAQIASMQRTINLAKGEPA